MFRICYYYDPIIEKNDDGVMFINLYLSNGRKSKKFIMYDNNYKDLLTKVQSYIDRENEKIKSSLYNRLITWLKLNYENI